MEPLRIGVLGAARITTTSLIPPARALGHRLVAVAARDPRRAQAYAAEHGFERAAESYAALLADPEVDCVYNPLANGLHGQWNIAAARAGKHVLAEKPSAANAEEAAAVRDAVDEAGVVFLEGFHYPWHPIWRRILDIVASGELGDVHRVEAPMAMEAPAPGDPRWRADLAGGAVMDVGCYALTALRWLGPMLGGEPAIRGCRMRESPEHPGVDVWAEVTLDYPGGAVGVAGASMEAREQDFSLTVRGSRGVLHAPSFMLPHLDDRVVVEAGGERREEHLGTRSSYAYQLEAFAAAVREGAPALTDAAWAVRSMEWVDTAYELGGLGRREPAADS